MRIRFRHTVCFQKTEYMESRARLGNPGCGWYHIYTFVAGPFPENSSVEEEIWMDDACREEQLALVLIDIGAFRAREMTKEAIRYISQILDFFRRNQKQMILRFVYDREGKGMTRTPHAVHGKASYGTGGRNRQGIWGRHSGHAGNFRGKLGRDARF